MKKGEFRLVAASRESGVVQIAVLREKVDQRKR